MAADYEVQLGKAESLYFIGVQPPLEEDQIKLLQAEVAIPNDIQPQTGAALIDPIKQGEAYTEFGYLALNNEDDPDKTLLGVAEDIARILSCEGSVVHLNQPIRPLGKGSLLFDGKSFIS